MKGEENLYRLRVGDYRFLFEMNEKTQEITLISIQEVTLISITDADNRGQIYK